MGTASQAVAWARSQIGYKEGKNNWTKYGQEYGWNNVPWCCIMIWCDQTHVGVPVLKTASCTQLWNWARGKGLSVSKRSLKKGDIVFFDFSGGSQCNHVGIVESVGASRVTTIEGNTSSGNGGSQSNGDGVYRRYRSYGVISHAYRPQYEKDEEMVSVNIPMIQKGSKGSAVFVWQSFLKQKGYAVGDVDGDFGSKTTAATKAYQKANGLSQDGIVGKASWSKAFGV